MDILSDPFSPVASGEIFKRDACTNAFGNGWVTNMCTPGSTLCCVNPDQKTPSCQQYLGLGWCCTQNGGCYADLTPACGQPAAVQCPQVAAGVAKSCCPQYTTCAPGYNATNDWVRCNINETSLTSLASSTTSLSGATVAFAAASTSTLALVSTDTIASNTTTVSLSSTSPISTASRNTPVPVTTPAHTSPNTDLNTRVIAGITVGGAVSFILICAIIWYMCRRRRHRTIQVKNKLGTSNSADKEPPRYEHSVPPAVPEKEGAKNSYGELAGVDAKSPVELAVERF